MQCCGFIFQVKRLSVFYKCAHLFFVLLFLHYNHGAANEICNGHFCMYADISRAYLKLFQSLSKEVAVHANHWMVLTLHLFFWSPFLAIFWTLYTTFFLSRLILSCLGTRLQLIMFDTSFKLFLRKS